MRQIIRVLKTPVTLLVLLGFVLAVAAWAYSAVRAPIAPRQTPCVMQDVGASLNPDRVTVRAYNGGTTDGLAKRAATHLRAYGFKVIKIANSDRRIQQTVVVGDTADNPVVKLVLGFFKDALFESDGRIDGTVDVYVGNAYAGMAEQPATSIAVNGPVCLPPVASTSSATPTPAPTK